MFKPATIIVAATLAGLFNGGAFAQEAQQVRFATTQVTLVAAQGQAQSVPVGSDAMQANAASARDVPSAAAEGHSVKGTRRPRKEYPNVMGISITEWLAKQP